MEQELLHKYFRNESSVEEEKLILDWVEASAENRKAFEKERMLFDIALFSDEKVIPKNFYRTRLLPIIKWSVRGAAVVLILIGIANLVSDYNYAQTAQLQTVTVPAGQRAEITLADGTTVWLNSKSTLSYSSNFGQEERNVELNGEAFFKVAKNKKIPFLVHTEHNQLQVVGTQFNVCAYRGTDEFETTLVEGIVDVYDKANLKQPLTRLTKDDFLTLHQGRYVKSKPHSYDYLKWKEGLYCFDDSPFSYILNKLEKYYNIAITVSNQKVLDYHCTGKFKEQDGIEHILKAIQRDHQFTYKMNAERDSITIE